MAGLTRRVVLAAGLAAPAVVRAATAGPEGRLAELERRSGGRLGVAVLDTGSGRRLGHKAHERFAMCSTFKALAVASVLSRADEGRERLDRRIPVRTSDLLSYAPAATPRVGGDMTVAELCEAAVTLSDNTAANLLLRTLGGPAGVTAFARGLGDGITRLDRWEPELNSAIDGDPRDTTTPAAMLGDLQKLLLGHVLAPASRDQLAAWMVACRTGTEKLRAGLPRDWRVGDKTGSGAHGASNDVAVLWPPGRAPILACVYTVGSEASAEAHNAVFVEVGRIVAGWV